MKLMLAWLIVSILLLSMLGLLLCAAYKLFVTDPFLFATLLGILICVVATAWACNTLDRQYGLGNYDYRR